MAESTLPKVRQEGTTTVVNGAAASYTVAYEDGDVGFGAEKNARIVVRDRGVITSVRSGDAPVIQVTFSVHFRQFTDGADLNLLDILDKRGSAAAWTNTTGIYSDFPSFNWSFTVEGTTPDGADHVATFANCIGTWKFAEGEPDKVEVTLECHGGITYTGPA